MAGPVNGNSVHAYDYAAVGQSYNYNPYAAQNGYRLDQHDSDILVVDSQPNGQEREELLFSSQPFSQGRPGHGHGQGQGQGAPQQQHHYGQGSMLEASQDEQIGTQLEASQESYNPTQPVATPSNGELVGNRARQTSASYRWGRAQIANAPVSRVSVCPSRVSHTKDESEAP